MSVPQFEGQPTSVSWLPTETFLEFNKEPLIRIFDKIHEVFPESGVEVVTNDDLINPSLEAMDWMWKNLMGHQHGSQEGFIGKLQLKLEQEYLFWPALAELKYGPLSFVHSHPVDSATQYNKAFVLGGYTQENIVRILAALGNNIHSTNVDDIIVMNGQRLRWNIPGESSVEDLYEKVREYSGTYPSALAQSPFIKFEEQRTGESWSQPFATEYDIGRLCVEALFDDLIDWCHYDDVVEVTLDNQGEPQEYITNSGTQVVPARTDQLATYYLLDGKRVHVLNAKAVARRQGIPRPTSDSQTREASEVFSFGEDESLLFAANVPHVRAAIDALIRIVDLRKPNVGRADITSAYWLPEKELLAALGEIPATHKADLRLRAVLAGSDPDAPELANL